MEFLIPTFEIREWFNHFRKRATTKFYLTHVPQVAVGAAYAFASSVLYVRTFFTKSCSGNIRKNERRRTAFFLEEHGK
jgi:hypothetical protein